MPWQQGALSLGLIGCLCFAGAHGLVQRRLPQELRGIRSSHSCTPIEPGQHPDHRVCFFTDLLVYNGSLIYIGDDARQIPTVNTEYWLGGQLQDWLTNVTAIDRLPTWPQRTIEVERAALSDWPFYHNYFHVFAEYLPSLHNVLCRYWNDCSYNAHTDLDILLLTPGVPFNHSRNAVQTDAARCVTNKPISAISATDNNTRVAILLKEAVAGWGPECRADHWHCQPWYDKLSTSFWPGETYVFSSLCFSILHSVYLPSATVSNQKLQIQWSSIASIVWLC